MRFLTYETTTQNPIHNIENAKTSLLNQSKKFCQEWCNKKGYQKTEFAHWIAIAELSILLTFRHQTCIELHQLNVQLPLLLKGNLRLAA